MDYPTHVRNCTISSSNKFSTKVDSRKTGAVTCIGDHLYTIGDAPLCFRDIFQSTKIYEDEFYVSYTNSRSSTRYTDYSNLEELRNELITAWSNYMDKQFTNQVVR